MTDYYASYSDEFFIATGNSLAGPPGPQGIQGNTGYTGPVGTGTTGPTGTVGPTGPPVGSISPVISRTIYVATFGNDTTGDGSFPLPFATLSRAVTLANSISSTSAPVVISINSGNYTENNSAGPITITAGGISVNGDSASTVFIYPSTVSQNLIQTTVGVQFNNITFDVVGTSSATCLVCSGLGNTTNLYNCRIFNYSVGINFDGTSSSYLLQDCVLRTCTTHIIVSAVTLVMNNVAIQGSATAVPAGTGIVASGAGTSLLVSGGLWVRCTTLLSLASNSSIVANAVSFRNNTYDIVATSSSVAYITGCSFTYGSSPSDITIQASGAGTSVQVDGCQLSGTNIVTGLNQGVGVQVTDGADLHIIASQITYFQVGANAGISSLDTSSTLLELSGTIFDTCDQDITQYGTATLDTDNCRITLAKISFNDATNISMNFVETATKEFSVGRMTDTTTSLVRVLTNTNSANVPILKYFPSFYGYDAMVNYNVIENNAMGAYTTYSTALSAITALRTNSATIQLFSDTSGTIGSSSALRGWQISKTGTSGNLLFNYSNNDLSGQSLIPEYPLMYLDGVNKYLALDSNAQIQFDLSTNLYRSSTGVLKSDGTIMLGSLTPNTALYADSNKQVSSSITTSTELGYLSGVTSSIQTQLNNKLSLSGGTLSGNLTLPNGASNAPSLNFASSNTSGLYYNSEVGISYQGSSRMTFGTSGVTIPTMSTGIVHSAFGGLLSSSLIVNADITDGTVTNSKLATVSSTDTSGYIVARDSSGNFATHMITIDGTPAVSTDVATKGYVDSSVTTGIVPVPPALVVSTTNVAPTGLYTIDSVLLVDSDRVLLVSQTGGIQNGVWLAHTGTWTRPTDPNDFNTGTGVGNAYVLVTSGTINGGASYLCSTPTAIVDTNPITMEQFALGGSVTNASNIGIGIGTVFSNKVGSILNFKNFIQGGGGIALTNGASDITIATNATGTNTVNTVVSRDNNGNFSAGTITANLNGIASQNVAKTGDIMTGDLILPAGSVANPSLGFTGSITTGLSVNSNALSVSVLGGESIRFSSTGVIIDSLTGPGVVHSDLYGNLTTSLVVNADVSASAGIVDTKLATISTSGKVLNSATTATGGNIPSSIVARDASGNFSAGNITANLSGNVTGSASLNVLKSGDTMSGNLTLPAGTSTEPSLNFSGSTTSGLSANAGSLVFTTSGTGAMFITSAGVVGINQFTVPGVVHNDGSGNLSSSTIVNADISASANISDTKLATISTSGKVSNSATTATGGNVPSTIVARDTLGNFSAGTITANLIGNVTGSASTVITNANMTGAFSSQGNTGYLRYADVSATGSVTTNITTDVSLTGTFYTPEAGTYLGLFSAVVSATTNNRTVTTTIYIDGSPIITSLRSVFCVNANQPQTIFTNDIFTVDGTVPVGVYWRTSGGTATAVQRALNLIRLA